MDILNPCRSSFAIYRKTTMKYKLNYLKPDNYPKLICECGSECVCVCVAVTIKHWPCELLSSSFGKMLLHKYVIKYL